MAGEEGGTLRWPSMAALVAGGMVGGGIYVALGVVVEASGRWAWLAFVIAGIIAVTTAALVAPGGELPMWRAGMGAAAIFVSYEGFQLLTYEYDEIEHPQRTLVPVLVWSSVAVVAIYALVAVGATMLAGAGDIVSRGTVALSVAAGELVGTPGVIVMTVAAALATTAAINSTLFSTARLAGRVADDGELPAVLDHRNHADVPDRAMLGVVATAVVLVWVGSLSALVEAASLAFLTAFGAVNIIALREGVARRWMAWTALSVGALVGVALLYRLATQKVVPLLAMLILFAVAFGLRPWVLRHTRTEDRPPPQG